MPNTYQAMIREWETELGVHVVVSPTDDMGSSGKKKQSTGEPVAMVRDYQFYKKSQPEAAKLFLEMVGHPLKTADILAGIEKGGVSVGGKTPSTKKTNLYTILNRSEDFGRIAKDTWGLVGWTGVKKEKDCQGNRSRREENGNRLKQVAAGPSFTCPHRFSVRAG
jgi:hypothetical protein